MKKNKRTIANKPVLLFGSIFNMQHVTKTKKTSRAKPASFARSVSASNHLDFPTAFGILSGHWIPPEQTKKTPLEVYSDSLYLFYSKNQRYEMIIMNYDSIMIDQMIEWMIEDFDFWN